MHLLLFLPSTIFMCYICVCNNFFGALENVAHWTILTPRLRHCIEQIFIQFNKMNIRLRSHISTESQQLNWGATTVNDVDLRRSITIQPLFCFSHEHLRYGNCTIIFQTFTKWFATIKHSSWYECPGERSHSFIQGNHAI